MFKLADTFICFNYYRPQLSSKVIFSQASVILSTGGGGSGCVSQNGLGQTLPPQADRGYVSKHTLGQTSPRDPLWADNPALGGHPWADTPRQIPPRQTPPGRHPPLQTTPWADYPQADTPGQTPPRQHLPWRPPQHPTGMLSCFEFHWCFFYEHLIYLFQDFCTPELWIKFRPFEKINMITHTCSYLTQISKCLPQFRSK